MLGGTVDDTVRNSLVDELAAAGYRLGAPLGAGVSGWVFQAERAGQRCAFKIARSGWRDWLAREALVLHQLGGVAAPACLELGSFSDGRPFLAMELIDGCSLRRSAPAGGSLLRAVAAAIDALHARSIVHRDLKPDHILIGSRRGAPSVRLVDFGLARREGTTDRGDEDRLTATGQRVGTARYMAPEQIRSGGAVSRASDIYALGAILFEMLTGVAPFRADNVVDLQLQHLHERPPRASDLADVPRALDRVIHTALAKDPRARFDSAGELARAAADALVTRFDGSVERSRSVAMTALLGLRGHLPLVGLRSAVHESGGVLATIGDTTIVVFPLAASCADGLRRALRLARRLRPAAELSVVHVADLRYRGTGGRGQVYGAPLVRPETWIPDTSTACGEILVTAAASCFVDAVRASVLPDYFALRSTSAPTTNLGASFTTALSQSAITEVTASPFGGQA